MIHSAAQYRIDRSGFSSQEDFFVTRRFLLLAWLALQLTSLPAASAATSEVTAQIEAQRMMSAFLKGDLEAFAGYTHSNVIKMNGGKHQMLDLLKKGLGEMKKQRVSFESAQVQRPAQVVHAGKELHTVLPMNLVMRKPEGRFLVRSFLIGVSPDAGKTWSFVDGARITAENVHKVLPDFNDRLRLPAKQPPQELK
jgi:hypothetical protein